ncbi:MAG TPA: CARDB domain-containing protein [Ferruginibacter sp.]|nr:CARDB domain-containing protein [Ferruginibacter sp.]
MKDFIHAISACKAPILRLSILLQFVLFFYEGALQAQAPQILKDINGLMTNNSQVNTGYVYQGYNGFVYFSADDGINGYELWKTDGTEAGTVMVKDINPGLPASTPQFFIEMGGYLFFTAYSAGNITNRELWRTDGTEAGTIMVKDIYPGNSSSNPVNLVKIGNAIYFSANNPTSGQELWKSDGTEAGTVLVKDIATGSGNGAPLNMKDIGGVLYFTAVTSTEGREFWKTDGTEAGTILLKDIYTGASNSNPGNITAVSSNIFFTATDAMNGTELWKTDGTEAGTVLVKDIRPGSTGSSMANLIALNNKLVFTAWDGTTGTELWISDGTDAGTLLADINAGTGSSSPSLLVAMGNMVYFSANDGVNGSELWKTDGTVAGTVMVKDINTGTSGSNPGQLININGTLYFAATSAGIGQELWKTDGTELGTMLVKDINPGANNSTPTALWDVTGTLYLLAYNGTQWSLMKSDGTAAGTVALNSTVVNNGTYKSFYGYQNKLFFMYNGYLPGVPITATGNEPWVSDGTDAGTTLIKDINITTNAGNPSNLIKAGNTVFFNGTDATNGAELWKTDGTEAGTVLVKDIYPGTSGSNPQRFAFANNIVFFTAINSTNGWELWKTDGTETGTVLIKDIRPGTSNSAPTYLTVVGNWVYFVANDGVNGAELWKTDGTEAGTVMVADIVAGSGSPGIQQLTNVNGTLFFRAANSGSDLELWKSDGTGAGTILVKDIRPGTTGSGPDYLTAYNGMLYFNANDGVNGTELWISDGTEAGTILLSDISPGSGGSTPSNLAVAEGKIYFSAYTNSTQYEPWISDGTAAGTFMITEVVPGGSGSVPFGFTGMNGYVYFSADATGTGRELWRTDGTALGTTLVKDIQTGTGDANPELLTVVNNTLFFRATMPGGGIELFQSDGTEAGTTGYDLYPGSTTSDPQNLTALNNMLLFAATDPIKNRELWKAVALEVPSFSFSISGDTTVCVGNTETYTAMNVVGNNISYHWSLPDGGGTLNATDSIATVTWTTTGTRSVALYLSNAAGSTPEKQKTVNVINGGTVPTIAPVIVAFGRTLTATNFPANTYCQWYRNGVAIPGADQASYYAADQGTYTARFVNVCATGPESNAISFANAAIAQTINFANIPDIQLTPMLKIPLNATSSSGLPVFFQKVYGPGYIQNDTIYFSGNGTLTGDVIINATQPGNDEYSPAPVVQQTFRVLRGNQAISFDTIPDMIFGDPQFPLSATATSGLPVIYSVVTGNNYVIIGGDNKIYIQGVGNVTIRASQPGNTNYLNATPVEQSFCIGVRNLSPILGDINPCLNTYRYNAQYIPGAIYQWTLSGGGILTTNKDTAWIQWQTPGNHTLKVKANSACDAVFTQESILEISTSNNSPQPVTGMLPAHQAIDQQLPLRLSWIPGSNTTLYDVYVWKSTDPQPATPYASNVDDISFTLPLNSFPYNDTYKWRVISKNPCSQTSGPIQEFSIIPLPDLLVSDVQAPATATSGQTITVSWKVTNVGPGSTLPTDNWNDGVFFAIDTLPNVNFYSSPNWSSHSWSTLTASGKPLILGVKPRPTQLASGQSYTNSLDFTLPLSYSFPVYVYVITNYNTYIRQVTVANDTARMTDPMDITLAPTPDLRVDSVFTPGTTFSGSTINLTYKVKNYGVLTPPGGKWVDSFFISQSPLFDPNTAIPLKTIKSNGSYYPNAPDLTVNNNNQLQQDSFYTKNVSAIIPNFIFGTWFIYAKTNARTTGDYIYEGPLNNNNLAQAQIQVYLTPTPKLTISSLNVPVTNAATTQPIGINWNIKNEGFRDNIEMNKGHILSIGSCYTDCPYGTPPNSVCTITSVDKDSLVFGSSYWIDRVYLSTDPGGLNISNAILVKETKHGFENSGLNSDAPSPRTSYESCPAIATENINVSNVINAGSNFPKSEGFTIPADLLPGNYYVYVYTNPTKSVFEYPGTPQTKRSDLPISIQRPDVTVSSISVPATSTGSQPISISYQLLNNGPGGVFNHLRHDRVYISNSAVFDGSAQLIDSIVFTENLQVGTAVPHTFVYNLPPGTSGTKYFYVFTNYDSLFRETNYSNNISAAAATSVTAATPADLVVSSVQPDDSVFTIYPEKIIYNVTNSGSGVTTGTWTDSVFISCNPVFSPASSYFIGKKSQTRTVAASGNYTDSLTVFMKYAFEYNLCFPEAQTGNAYFFVKTNADTGCYEASAINNNIGGSGIKPIVNPLVDHIVPVVTGADVTAVGASFTLDWRIRNIGYNPGIWQYYNAWYDGIYFSADSVVDAGDIKVAEYLKYLILNRGQDSGFTRTFTIPYMPGGDYYVYVLNNNRNSIPAEKILSNNANFIRNGSGAAKKIQVVSLPPALSSDLVDSIVSAPIEVAAGQPITVVYKVTNNGPGTTYPASYMHNRLWLSSDFLPNGGDDLLTTRNKYITLGAGQFYFDTLTATIPANTAPGNYVLISHANSSNTILETNTGNNLGVSLLHVFTPAATDLVMQNVMVPDTVMLGYTMDSAKWVISNLSPVEATGYTKDGIYISSSEVFDSTALLMGIKSKHIQMLPLQSDTVSMAPWVTGVAEGNYNVFVKTDLQFNILEENENNNVGKSSGKVYVKVKELPMNTDEQNTLKDTARYYKLIIPDSLYGATIMVTLTTPDSLTMRNEMFIAGNYVPSAAHYDYAFEIPNYGNQQIVINEVTDSVYYIMYRCVTPAPVLQNVTLKAVKLPFAILNVHSNAGGNIGNVTIRIRGSLFRDSMVAKLSNSSTTIFASAVYYSNSTQVFATFNLQGKPLGIYNVTLIKPDLSEAVLPNSFSIVAANNGGVISGGGNNTGSGDGNQPGCDPGAASGLNSQLVVDMIVPSSVLLKRPVVIQINYSNPTNFDLPAQTRILYSEFGMKMALTKAGVPTGTTVLYLELTEPGGPPGIIRAGGSGTILVHTVAPNVVPPAGFVWFKLK